MRMFAERIDNEPFLRFIKKWLKAGVLDTDGQVLRPESGTPQGGVITPVLANVYQHYALDLWFERVFQRSCKGGVFLHRYADDFVCGFGRAEMPSGSTTSWKNGYGSSDWNWQKTKHG
jgi:retron-type reverse transcriptase